MSTVAVKVANPQISSELISFCENYEWVDCWEIAIPGGSKASSYDWAQELFSGTSSPKILIILMNVKNRIMKPFRLSGQYDAEMIGTFPVFMKKEKETILGKHDKHLSFAVSVTYDDENAMLRCTTIMKTRNLLGRVYWFFVGKGHPLIIKTAMKHAEC